MTVWKMHLKQVYVQFHRVRSVRSQKKHPIILREAGWWGSLKGSWTWVIRVNSMLNFDVLFSWVTAQSLWARWQQGLVKLTLLFRIQKLAGLAKFLHQHLYFWSSNCGTDGIKISSPWPNSDVRNQFLLQDPDFTLGMEWWPNTVLKLFI